LAVFLTALLPGIELRGAIPLGMAFGMGHVESFIVAYLGSIAPSLPVLLLLTPLLDWLWTTRYLSKVADWIERRTLKGQKHIRRAYYFWGLLIFVAIPLPGTGVWTGSMIAAVLRLPVIPSFLAIALGDLVAGVIMVTFSRVFF
jgi:uncharacterized membrane protein